MTGPATSPAPLAPPSTPKAPPRRRFLQHPLVTLAAALLLGLLVWLLPDARRSDTRSTVGRAVGRFFGAHVNERPALGGTLLVYIQRGTGARAGSLTLHDPDQESMDWMADDVLASAKNIFVAQYSRQRVRAGFFAPTTDQRHDRLSILSLRETALAVAPATTSDATPKEVEAMRALFLSWFERSLWRDEGDLEALRANLTQQSTILWQGHAHNAAALLTLALMAWSLGWIPRAVYRWKLASREMALAKGLCPRCGYNTSGAERCTECGESLSHEPPSPAQLTPRPTVDAPTSALNPATPHDQPGHNHPNDPQTDLPPPRV